MLNTPMAGWFKICGFWRHPMKSLPFLALALIFAALTATSAAAQQRGGVPRLAPHALNPSMSLSAPSTGPLQQQMQDNYATQLRGTQRDLLQQNPSGMTRGEVAIGHELNGFTAPR
jgi:hypothetical protein